MAITPFFGIDAAFERAYEQKRINDLKIAAAITTAANATGSIRGELTAGEINGFRPNAAATDSELSASGAPIPVVFGYKSVPGFISAQGVDAGGNGIYRVFWCHGEVYQIGGVFINDAAPPASVEIRHYRGAPHQGVDDLVASITTLSGYAEAMVIAQPAGLTAVAYSVIKIPAGAISGAPRFQAGIAGTLVYDPRKSTTVNHVFDESVSYNLDFTQAVNGTGTTGRDLSANAHTVAWSGNAQVTSGKAVFDGNGDYVTLQDTTAADFGTGTWTLEISIETAVTTGTHYIFSKGDAASDRAIVISQITDDIYISLSSNGTTWGIANAVLIGSNKTPTTQPLCITAEFTGREYHFYINGFHTHRIQSSSALYATTRPVRLGLLDGGTATDGFNGTISGCRLTKGALRFGGVHGTIVSPVPAPYMDSVWERPGYVFSDTAAMVLAELARNPFFGLGAAQVYNEYEAYTFNEEMLPSGVERAQISLAITAVRSTVEWMDYVAVYAECFWFFLDDGIYIKPDRRVTTQRPSGWEMGTDGDFVSDGTDWTLGTGWTYYGGTLNYVQKTAGTASAIRQNVAKPFEAGVTYCAIMDIGVYFAGTVSLTLNGVTLIPATSAAGRHAVEFIASGSETGRELSCNADSAFAGLIGEISIKRKYWAENSIVRGSLSVSPARNSDSPTSVSVQYTTPNIYSANWIDAEPVIAQLPAVDTGDVPLLETTIDMRGVISIEEAENKALTRLMKMQNSVTVSYQTTDSGIALKRGFVVSVIDPETAINIKMVVHSVTATNDAGRYRVTGVLYDDAHYPSETETQSGTIPVGAITILREGAIPSGWAAYSAANGKYIKCAGSSVIVETTGGAATAAAIAGNTASAGAHGESLAGFYVDGFTATGGTASGNLYTDTDAIAGAHTHTYTTGTITPELLTDELPLVQKITSTATVLPANLHMFGVGGLNYKNMSRWLWGAGALLKAAAATAATGVTNQYITMTTGSTDDNHEHYTRSATAVGSPSVLKTDGVAQKLYNEVNGGGAHTHEATALLLKNPKRYKTALYTGTDDYGVGPGMMFLWPNLPIPANYTLCDGLLGTPDLEDYFLEIAADGEEDTATGDNTIGILGATKLSAKHEHKDTSDANYYDRVLLSHENEISHYHDIIGGPVSWSPPWYALSAIMYNPNPVPTWRDVGFQFSGGTAGNYPTDTGPDAITITNSGTPGIKWSAAQTLFGLNTLASGGTSNFFRTPTTFQIGPKFTIQGFFRTTALTSNVLMGNRSGTTTDRFRLLGSAGALQLLTAVGSTTSGAISLNVWYFFSVVYDGAQWRLYLGLQSSGVATLVGSVAQVIAAMPAVQVVIGGDFAGNNAFLGYYGEIRHTRGVALHTGSAIPIPTTALTTA